MTSTVNTWSRNDRNPTRTRIAWVNSSVEYFWLCARLVRSRQGRFFSTWPFHHSSIHATASWTFALASE